MPYIPSQQGMGIGAVGIGNVNTVFKRKFRWTLEIESSDTSGCTFKIPAYFVKLAARPSISFEENKISFLNDELYVPGRPTWEPLTVTYLDTNQTGTDDLLRWLTIVYDFTSHTRKTMSSLFSEYAAKATLVMWDGCGNKMERWTYDDVWPQAIDFGDLDYGSSEVAEIKLTLRYSQVTFENGCGKQLSPCRCTSCS